MNASRISWGYLELGYPKVRPESWAFAPPSVLGEYFGPGVTAWWTLRAVSTSHEKVWNLGFGLAEGAGPAPGTPDKTLLDLHFLLVGASLGTSGIWSPPDV